MSNQKGTTLLTRAGLVMWGLFTLALLFSVILLCVQLVRLGSNPLAFAVPEPVAVATPVAPDTGGAQTRMVTLYFGDPGSAMLRPERRSIPVSESTVENCKAAMKEIINGSTTGLTPLVPAATQVRSAYLIPDGELIVDLSAEALDAANDSAAAETLLVYGVVNSLAQGDLGGEKSQPVRKVRILIDGEPRAGHIDVSAAYAPDSSWIAAEPEAAKNEG